jgi:hypothetical protein
VAIFYLLNLSELTYTGTTKKLFSIEQHQIRRDSQHQLRFLPEIFLSEATFYSLLALSSDGQKIGQSQLKLKLN